MAIIRGFKPNIEIPAYQYLAQARQVVTSAAAALTIPAAAAACEGCFLEPLDGDLYMTLEGTAPTTSNGFKLPQGVVWIEAGWSDLLFGSNIGAAWTRLSDNQMKVNATDARATLLNASQVKINGGSALSFSDVNYDGTDTYLRVNGTVPATITAFIANDIRPLRNVKLVSNSSVNVSVVFFKFQGAVS